LILYGGLIKIFPASNPRRLEARKPGGYEAWEARLLRNLQTPFGGLVKNIPGFES